MCEVGIPRAGETRRRDVQIGRLVGLRRKNGSLVMISRPISKIDWYIVLWSPITESPISQFS